MGTNKQSKEKEVAVVSNTSKEEVVTVAPKLEDKGSLEQLERLPGETKSAWFRRLYDEHHLTVGQISRVTMSHYSFVYGVLDRHTNGTLRKDDSEPSKSDQIRALADQGMTVGQIAKQLNSNYSFVHGVVKRYREEKAEQVAQG